MTSLPKSFKPYKILQGTEIIKAFHREDERDIAFEKMKDAATRNKITLVKDYLIAANDIDPQHKIN